MLNCIAIRDTVHVTSSPIKLDSLQDNAAPAENEINLHHFKYHNAYNFIAFEQQRNSTYEFNKAEYARRDISQKKKPFKANATFCKVLENGAIQLIRLLGLPMIGNGSNISNSTALVFGTFSRKFYKPRAVVKLLKQFRPNITKDDTPKRCLMLCIYNTRTASTNADLYALLDAAKHIKYLVIALQETKPKRKEVRQIILYTIAESSNKKKAKKTDSEQLNALAERFLSRKLRKDATFCDILSNGARDLIAISDLYKGSGFKEFGAKALLWASVPRITYVPVYVVILLQAFEEKLKEWIKKNPVLYGCAGKPKGGDAGGTFACVLTKNSDCSNPRTDPGPYKPDLDIDNFVIKLNWTRELLDEFYIRNNIND